MKKTKATEVDLYPGIQLGRSIYVIESRAKGKRAWIAQEIHTKKSVVKRGRVRVSYRSAAIAP